MLQDTWTREARAGPHPEPPSRSSVLLCNQWPSSLTGLFVPTCLNTYDFFLFHLQPLISKYVSKHRARRFIWKLFPRSPFGERVSSSALLSQEQRKVGTETQRRDHPPKNIDLRFDNTPIKPQSHHLRGGFWNTEFYQDFSQQASWGPLASQSAPHRKAKSSPHPKARVPPSAMSRSARVAAPSQQQEPVVGLFSHLWPGGWTSPSRSPQRGSGPPHLPFPLLRSHQNERLKRPFHGGTGKACLYFFIILIFHHPFISRKKVHGGFVHLLSISTTGRLCLPSSFTPVWKRALESFPARDWGYSLFPITLLLVAWLHPFHSGRKTIANAFQLQWGFSPSKSRWHTFQPEVGSLRGWLRIDWDQRQGANWRGIPWG